MQKIENNELRVYISEKGAEMQTLTDVKTGREYFWQGDPKYWDGRSPVLFPATGGLWNDTYRYDGKEWKMPKHGFVKAKEWEVAKHTKCSVTFTYKLTDEDLAFFPFPSQVFVTYRLRGRKVVVDFLVKNQGTRTMYFQMGGHPAFNLPDFKEGSKQDAYIRLEGNPDHILRARHQGCIQPERFEVPYDKTGNIPVCVQTFANEALIFEKSQVKAATLVDLKGNDIVRVTTTAPCWLFWSMQDLHCPYVCFEPWYGLPDDEEYAGLYQQRPYLNKAAKGKTWEGKYTIEVF